MKSYHGEIEVYLCPDEAKTKQRTPIPPSDPLLADVLNSKSPFSPLGNIFNSTGRPIPSTSARRNLTFQNCPETKLSPSKDPVFNNFNMDTSLPNNSSISSIVQPMNDGLSVCDMNITEPLHFSPLSDNLQRILLEPSTSQNQSQETIRLKHALISDSDDFGPIANKYPLTMYDQGSAGKIILSFTGYGSGLRTTTPLFFNPSCSICSNPLTCK